MGAPSTVLRASSRHLARVGGFLGLGRWVVRRTRADLEQVLYSTDAGHIACGLKHGLSYPAGGDVPSQEHSSQMTVDLDGAGQGRVYPGDRPSDVELDVPVADQAAIYVRDPPRRRPRSRRPQRRRPAS
jgi:hypothetical protein